MRPPAVNLSTQLLVQFLAAVSSRAGADSASRVAAERAAAALEAEIGAIVVDGVAISVVGFPRGEVVPNSELAAVVARDRNDIELPGVGRCIAITAPIGIDHGHLLVARSGAGGFSAEESNLLRGMAHTLDLVLVMLRTLEAERAMRELSQLQAAENAALLISVQGRHRLLEQLMGIQREISKGAPLEHVLETIVTGAHELLGDQVASLCLLDRDDPSRFVHVTSRGFPAGAGIDSGMPWQATSGSSSVSWLAIAQDTVVVAAPAASTAEPSEPGGLVAAMAAPVRENGRAVGALFVGAISGIREYSDADRATLAAFAEQVSLAITDARTLEDMDRAHHDGLTGLASRGLFMERLGRAISDGARAATPLAVLFIDLDRFKRVNDTLGHSAGDLLLVEVADRLRSCLRPDDSAARFGGDEFAVLLERIGSTESAVEVAERILFALRQPIAVHGRQLFIEASVGIVTTVGDPDGAGHPARDPEALLRDADVAMYVAKHGGAGRQALFQVGMRTKFEQRVELESDFRGALERDEFVVHYQPILELASGRAACLEALVRWQHPRRGLLAPLLFIELAEETGLILPLGELVLKAACEQAQRWRSLLPPGTAPTVSVNLSGRQLEDADLARQVASALDESGLPASSLVLEITESVLLSDTPTTVGRLYELKDLGVRLAVDDFGAGYSSLQYLRAFPVDVLKIDKSFIDAIAHDSDAASLARAIIELGNSLRLETVAEGIETADQLQVLLEGHCRLGQGFYFSKPLNAEETQLWLTRDAGKPLPVAPARGLKLMPHQTG